MTDNDFINFQEEMLLSIREIEHKMTDQLNAKIAEVTKNYEKFNEKMNALTANHKSLIETMAENTVKLEKIPVLEKFKLKADEKIVAHEIKISNFSEELNRIKNQYENLFIENFNVPGFIGKSCQYKNVSEYLSTNIIEFSKFKIEKEQLKKDNKDLKSKMEALTKTIISMNDNSVEKCNEYAENMFRNFKSLMEAKIGDLSKSNNDFKSQISVIQSNVQVQVNFIKSELEKIRNLKNNIISFMDTKDEESSKSFKDFNKKLMSNFEEISLCRKELKNIEQTVIKLNKNFNDVSFSMKNVKNEPNNFIWGNYNNFRSEIMNLKTNKNNVNSNSRNNNLNINGELTNIMPVKNDTIISNAVFGNILQSPLKIANNENPNSNNNCNRKDTNTKTEIISTYNNKTKRFISSNIINSNPIKLKKKIEFNTDILFNKKINNYSNSESDMKLYDKKDELVQMVNKQKKAKENSINFLYNKELEEEKSTDYKLINLKLDKKACSNYRSSCAIIFSRKLNNKDFTFSFSNDTINIVIPKEGKNAWKTHFFSESARKISDNMRKTSNNFNKKIMFGNYPKIINEKLFKKIKEKEPSKSGRFRYRALSKP